MVIRVFKTSVQKHKRDSGNIKKERKNFTHPNTPRDSGNIEGEQNHSRTTLYTFNKTFLNV